MPKLPLLLVSLIVLPLAAVITHQMVFAGVDRPTNDHGSGSMFDLIATRYDMINRILAVGMDIGWRKQMVMQIKHKLEKDGESDPETRVANPQILDVSTGTADVALLLSKAMPHASILGIDPSANMLDIGRGKVQERGRQGQVDLQQFDARDLSMLDPASFDAATMAFGIRNVPERNVALCQIHRLLKDQSRFCILEFSEPDDSFGTMGKLARFFINNVVPFLGGVLSGAPQEYWHLQNSIKDFPSPKEFAKQINHLTCDTGDFHVDRVHQLNYGAVQIYTITIKRPTPPTVENEEVPQEQ
eukprot:CAMPEP_0172455290 /NCGR_PEP_ID=MMETSP1065-20121228/11992_1 /TAXON_ID=265537 /ORGANISM="Amphiprora paludosa, Strain CCMP125" /LENGTH=300 /DNA_ID=CAMNT_0013207751 /DNA_START=67 /DNA_END=969 /DNA_ORIENTATION=-